MTRAALTRSGSWLTVPATQSMYDGSKAAICPSVWPWNLPNAMTVASAASSDGGRRPAEVAHPVARRAGRSASTRAAASRPTTSVAHRRLAAQRRVRPAPFAERPGCAAGRRPLMSTRPVTGRVGFGARRPAAAARGAGLERRARRDPSRRRAVGRPLAGQRRVGVVDLGHPPGRQRARRPDRRRSGPGGWPGEPPPGGLDLGRGGAAARRRGRHADRVWPYRPSVRRRRRRRTAPA